MALEFAHGAIQWLSADGIGTLYTVSGLAFQPKAFRFYMVGIGSATDAATETVTSRRSVGFATSTTDQRCVASADVDASGSMACSTSYRNDRVLDKADGTSGLKLDAVSATAFRLQVSDGAVGSDITVFWEAWGGSDISVAVTGNITEPAATGDVDYTVTGFEPGATDQVVMFAGCQATASGVGTRNDSGLCVGFATSGTAADNVHVVGNNDDGSAAADTDGYCKTGECLSMITVAGGNPNARAQLTQFGTDNFRLNWIARGVTGREYIFLAIKGGSWEAGSVTIDGTTVSQTASTGALGFTAKGVSAMGRMTAEDVAGTATAQDRLSLGSSTGISSLRSMGHLSEDGAASTEIDLTIQYDLVLAYPSTAGGLQHGYVLTVGTSVEFGNGGSVGGVVDEWIGYLTFGDAPGAAAGPSRWSFIGAP